MLALIEALCARVPLPLAEEIRTHAADLVALVGRAERAHPGLEIPTESWVEFFAQHLQQGDVAVQFVDLHAEDVHLILACRAGVTQALAQLDRRLRAVAPQALAGIRLGALTSDELLQQVRTKLVVGADGKGKLDGYAGRGPLEGWLRVVIARGALSIVRAHPKQTSTLDESKLMLLATDDPQLTLLRESATPKLERALRDALAALPSEARVLLRLQVFEGLTIDDLAALYKAHRATMARRLARIRNQLIEDVRARARDLLGVGETEFQSLMG